MSLRRPKIRFLQCFSKRFLTTESTENDVEEGEGNDENDGKPAVKEKTVCLFDESPYFILKVAAQNNLNEVKRLLEDDEVRLAVRDYRGQNIFHYVAQWSRVAIMDFLYDNYLESPHFNMNVRDKLGNTPLHFAVEKNQTKAVEWFVSHDACLTILNNNSAAPIHMAVENNRIKLVELMIAKDTEQVQLSGDFGYTPLQYACSKDLPDMAKYLILDEKSLKNLYDTVNQEPTVSDIFEIKEGSDMFRNNDIGYSAIHAAVRNGASKVIRVLIECAGEQGISAESLIHTLDKEKNFPLHTAVNSGDIKAVNVCLEAGADINAQHPEDKQTAVHYAASKGSVEILKVLFAAQPEKVESCLHCRDILDQTPIHKAAGFNHVAVVELLIELGASLNPQDAERRTPLVLAASKGAFKAVNFLLVKRSNTSLRDKDNRNFLHLTIMTGLKLVDVNISNLKNLKQLLNERDDFGCCPLHYASKGGQLTTVKHLLSLGAHVTLKDNEKQSPLHFAAKFGKLQTAKNLLHSEQGALLINEVDGEGKTPLLVAAMYGHYKVIALLVRKGAQMTKDFEQNTALHVAAEYGNHEAVVLLVGLAPHLLNATNKQGNTALHLAAMNGYALIVDYLLEEDAKFEHNMEQASFFDLAILRGQGDAAAAVIRHQRYEEAMQLDSIFGSPIVGLIQHLPKICILFLDKCITYAAENKKSRAFYIRYDFRYLKTPQNVITESKAKGANMVPMLPLNMMVKHNRVECLAHPLCVNFLKRKWSAYGASIYNFRIAIYILFLGLLTSVAYDIDAAIGEETCTSCNDETEKSPQFLLRNNSEAVDISQEDEIEIHVSSNLLVRMVLVAAFCLVNLFMQFFTIFQQKLAYFFDFSHYIELTLYISTFCMTTPSIISVHSPDMEFVCSVICIFLGWINLLLYMQRFDFFGIYVVMFVEIFKTVVRVFIVFSFIIIAFALTMTIVFRSTNGPSVLFYNPWVSIIGTLSMMLGEMNYVNLISPSIDGRVRLLHPTVTYICYCAFIILIPILLTNLLVGLAVGNIEMVQKNARLKRLAMQVEFFTALERRLPKAFLKRRLFDEWLYYPNKSGWKFVETIMSAMKESGGTDDDIDEEESRNDFAYLLEELTMQSKHLNGLGTKFDTQQDLLKVIVRKMDAELFNDGKVMDPDMESGGEEDEQNHEAKAKNQKISLTEFRSPGARAQWHAVTTRFAASRKSKASNFALVEDDDDASKGRGSRPSGSQSGSIGD